MFILNAYCFIGSFHINLYIKLQAPESNHLMRLPFQMSANHHVWQAASAAANMMSSSLRQT